MSPPSVLTISLSLSCITVDPQPLPIKSDQNFLSLLFLCCQAVESFDMSSTDYMNSKFSTTASIPRRERYAVPILSNARRNHSLQTDTYIGSQAVLPAILLSEKTGNFRELGHQQHVPTMNALQGFILQNNTQNSMVSTGNTNSSTVIAEVPVSTSSPSSPSPLVSASESSSTTLSRYENQKRRDWITFSQYLRNHRPPLSLSRCSGAHVLEFLRYLDQFGKTKVHTQLCPFFGHPHSPAPCPCPLSQAWGSLDALVGRLRAAFEENGGKPEANPFGSRAVRLYLREVRDSQAKARGISYGKKKRKRPPQHSALPMPTPNAG